MTRREWLATNPLLRWRLERALSRRGFARLLGVSATCLLYWERGDRRPRVDTWQLVLYHTHIGYSVYSEWWRARC